MTRYYLVEIPLPGGDQWLALARCTEAEHAAELVRVLVHHGDVRTVRVSVQVEIGPAPPF